MKVIAVIPARYSSSRFAGKVLANKTGKYLVQHTYEQTLKAEKIDAVYIAADDVRVQEACKQFGAECIMTSSTHQSGTDRIAEAVKAVEGDIIVNVQADEPELDPTSIEKVVELLKVNPDAQMATLVTRFSQQKQISSPNVVKCITDQNAKAIYFSRSVIPFARDKDGIGDTESYLQHIGIYAYRRDFLFKITELPQTPLEKLEKLEQLRAIEHGYTIMTAIIDHAAEGIDTPQQYDDFVKRHKSGKQK